MKKRKFGNKISHLPTEIIANILSFSWERDRRIYRGISRAFDDTYKFTHFTFLNEIKDFCTTFLIKKNQFNFELMKVSNLYSIKKIRFYNYVNISDLIVILYYCKNVKTIIFHDHVNLHNRTKDLIKYDPEISDIAKKRFSKIKKVYSKSKIPKILLDYNIKRIEKIPCFYCDKIIKRKPSICYNCNKTFCKACKVFCLDKSRKCMGCRKKFFSKCSKCKSRKRVSDCRHCYYSFCFKHSRTCKLCKKKKCLKCFDIDIKEYCTKCLRTRIN